MKVTVKRRHWTTEVYHTREDCSNKQRMSRPKEITQEKAEALGLSECKLCTHSLPEQNHTRRSLRYAIQSGEVDIDAD